MKKTGPSPEKAEEVRLKRDIGKSTKLKQLRLSRGLSQSELAKLTDISVKTLQKYEIANRPIDGAKLDTLCQISLALDCHITEILESDELIEKFNKLK